LVTSSCDNSLIALDSAFVAPTVGFGLLKALCTKVSRVSGSWSDGRRGSLGIDRAAVRRDE
jgi:hypothetical protein